MSEPKGDPSLIFHALLLCHHCNAWKFTRSQVTCQLTKGPPTTLKWMYMTDPASWHFSLTTWVSPLLCLRRSGFISSTNDLTRKCHGEQWSGKIKASFSFLILPTACGWIMQLSIFKGDFYLKGSQFPLRRGGWKISDPLTWVYLGTCFTQAGSQRRCIMVRKYQRDFIFPAVWTEVGNA